MCRPLGFQPLWTEPHAWPLYLERVQGECVDLTRSNFGGQVAPPNPEQPLDEVFPFARVVGIEEHVNFSADVVASLLVKLENQPQRILALFILKFQSGNEGRSTETPS